jgi:hypothetical protein
MAVAVDRMEVLEGATVGPLKILTALLQLPPAKIRKLS